MNSYAVLPLTLKKKAVCLQGRHMGAHMGGHMGAHTPLQSTFVMHDGKIITLPLLYHTGYIYIVYHYLVNTRTIKGA